ncbi:MULTISPECIES: hypothetical protein [unclassified Streptomyces]|uniref:hypothetical protein n=1 Tax=unclassified Streptomyces TaxID=2593676 RepID=UPI0036608955
MVLMMAVVIISAAAPAAGYLLGRLRPWRQAGDWAADQVRHAGTWVRGGAGRQAVAVLVHVVTAPGTSWRIMHTPAADTSVPVPVRDPQWVAHRTRADKRGTL